MYDQGPLGPRALNKVSARPRQPGGRHAVILLGDTSSRDGRLRAVQGFQHPVNASSADAERPGDLGGAVALRLHSRVPWPRLSKAAAGRVHGAARLSQELPAQASPTRAPYR